MYTCYITIEMGIVASEYVASEYVANGYVANANGANVNECSTMQHMYLLFHSNTLVQTGRFRGQLYNQYM